MPRNLKAVVLALVAIFAVSAVAASAAWALPGKLTSTGPVTLVATEAGVNRLTAFGGLTECPGSVGTAHKVLTAMQTAEGKVHELIPSGSSVITGTSDMNQGNCKVIEGSTVHKMTITLNGCDTDLQIGESLGENKFSSSGEIVCPSGKDIEEEIYAFSGSELGGVVCKLTEKPQAGLAGPTISNGSGDLTISGTIKGIDIERSGAGCSTETTKVGEADVNVTVEGRNAEGGATTISIS